MADDKIEPGNRLRLLAQEFPALWNAPGVRPWDALAFEAWAASGKLSHGELCCARFLLSVWDSNHKWKCGHFDVMDALRVWDQLHRKAFLDWAEDPWWA
jgi:hypothetical protein